MTARSLAQQANALITSYVKLYKDKYQTAPIINRYRDRWGFQAMIEDLGRSDAQAVLLYYFELSGSHDVTTLFRSYDELHKQRLAEEEDKRRVAQLHIETAKRVKEWLEKNGKRGTSGTSGGL
jgi:HEPN domain-containing protein